MCVWVWDGTSTFGRRSDQIGLINLRACALISNSSIPDWLHPLNCPRLACLSLPPTLHIFPLCFFPLHDFISLLYFFIHETEKSLSLIICLISSFPRSFFTSSKSIYPEAGPCTSFHILLENSCRAVAEVYPIVFTTKEVLKRLVLLLYQTPWPYVDCVSIVFVVLSIGNPLASSLLSRIAKKVTKSKTPLQNLTRVSSGKGLTSA